MEVEKKKRGRKPKNLQTVDTTVPSVKQKRGRKPKAVYNSYDSENNFQSISDDENAILQLSNNSLNIIDAKDKIPDAYNYDCVDTFVSQPSQVEDVPNCITAETNKKKVVELLKDFEEKNKNNEWPLSTSIHCYWCCHKFDTIPFGIPLKYTDNKFSVFGCFCSLECAAAYNFNSNENMNETWERYNLLNMLARKVNYTTNVKPAPSKLALKTFGGYMGIEEFREFCRSSKIVNVNFPPMMTITQQIEEINEFELHNDYKFIPLDANRVNKYKEKLCIKRTKPINNFHNTLDHTMNIKINTT